MKLGFKLIKKRPSAYLILLGAVSALAPIYGGSPTDQIRTTSDQLIAILRDDALKGQTRRPERNEKLRAALKSRFDWRRISQGCLGIHWRKRTSIEKDEFIRLFTRLLERTYLDRIEPYFSEFKQVNYLKERIRGNYASVLTSVVSAKNEEFSVEYRLRVANAGPEWMVYDVLVEGVSLVKNYRTQFTDILRTASFSDLLLDLQSKIEEQQKTP